MTMKNPNDPIGNRIRDLPAGGTVPQPTWQAHRHVFLPYFAGVVFLRHVYLHQSNLDNTS